MSVVLRINQTVDVLNQDKDKKAWILPLWNGGVKSAISPLYGTLIIE